MWFEFLPLVTNSLPTLTLGRVIPFCSSPELMAMRWATLSATLKETIQTKMITFITPTRIVELGGKTVQACDEIIDI